MRRRGISHSPYDIMVKQIKVVATDASGRFPFDAPASRAVLFHFRRD